MRASILNPVNSNVRRAKRPRKMSSYTNFLQIDPTSFLPFNDAPRYLSGRVESDNGDSLVIQGHAKPHMQAWHRDRKSVV